MMLTDDHATLRISPNGIALLKRFEGLRLTAYRDIVGVWTIGYGDTLHVSRGMVITRAEAEERLRHRLETEFEPAVNRYAWHPHTTQNQYDAMISLCWNIGTGRPRGHPLGPSGFAGSSVARYHTQGLFAQAAESFLLWRRAKGREVPALLKRRQIERTLYGM